MSATANQSLTAYDFRRAGHFSAEVEAYLSCWHRNLCDVLPDRWGEFVSFDFEWKVKSLESARPFEALSRLPEFVVGYQIVSKLDDAAMLFVVPRALALVLVVGMLGDSGESLPDDRELTALEHSLAETAVLSLVDVLNDSQPTLESMAFRYDSIEAHPQRTRMFSADSQVGIVKLAISAPFGEQEVLLLLSEKTLDAVEETVEASQGAKQGARAMLENLVREMPVEVVVRLGNTSLRVSELTKLRAGDVLVLDQRISEPLQADVNGELRYRGWPGRSSSRQAFQIATLVDG
jgi:flagellar motor switch protein FliM